MTNWMDMAVDEAKLGIKRGDGGPFGAVVVRKGRAIAKAHNMVPTSNDPTAHAEILAIRKASSTLKRFDLSDCTLYSTCEPCPMCLAAIHWARIGKVVYGATRHDAAAVGFDDADIYKLMGKSLKKASPDMKQQGRKGCVDAMETWAKSPDKIPY
ncbi:MAG: nucleoside deaminase [archaeon]